MRTISTRFILFSLIYGACLDVQALAVADYAAAEAAPVAEGYSLDWGYIYQYKNSSSVAVDHYWILTAAHVADDGGPGNLTVDGETYTQQEIVFHPSADLALVRYDKPLPGYYLLHSGEIHNGKNGAARVYDPLIMAGYGNAGTVSASSYTQGSGSGIKRWGTNRGEGETDVSTDLGGALGTVTTRCFRAGFDLSDTSYEAGANDHDSGGPVFIESEPGVWKLTGLLLYRAPASGPYTDNYAAMLPDQTDWIKSVIVDYDSDMDGLPDWWEALHGMTEAGDDPDVDGFTNYEEWVADTDPDDETSFLAITAYTNASSLTFTSSTNRKYRVLFRTDLADTNELWQTEVSWFAPTNASQAGCSVSSVSGSRFFRVEVKIR
ncbi:MAG TPA: trypsin-like peptidase domain-containing protein [Pontiella sp.]